MKSTSHDAMVVCEINKKTEIYSNTFVRDVYIYTVYIVTSHTYIFVTRTKTIISIIQKLMIKMKGQNTKVGGSFFPLYLVGIGIQNLPVSFLILFGNSLLHQVRGIFVIMIKLMIVRNMYRSSKRAIS